MVSIGIDLSVKPIIEHIKRHLRIVLAAAGTSPKPIGRIAAIRGATYFTGRRCSDRSLFPGLNIPQTLPSLCDCNVSQARRSYSAGTPPLGLLLRSVLRAASCAGFSPSPALWNRRIRVTFLPRRICYSKYGLNFTPNNAGCQWGKRKKFCSFHLPFMQIICHIMKKPIKKTFSCMVTSKTSQFLNLTTRIPARIIPTLERAKALESVFGARFALFLFSDHLSGRISS